MAQDVVEDPLGGGLVGKVETRGVDKREAEGVELLDTVVAGDGLVDVDGHGPDVGGEASTALDEAGDGGELADAGKKTSVEYALETPNGYPGACARAV